MSTRERIQQTIARYFELRTAKEEADKVVSAATSSRNALLVSKPVEPAVAEAAGVKANAVAGIVAEYDRAIEQAMAPVRRAQAVFAVKERDALQVRDSLSRQAEEQYEASVAAAKRAFEMAMAEADAEVHLAKQRAQETENALERFTGQVRQELNLDLNALVHASEE